MKINRNEQGQAIVLIILTLVALVGFAGLAVDGGRVYSEQRQAQNAADSAAYAAAMAAVNGDNPFEKALNQAAMNNFLDIDQGENSESAVDVIVNNPPSQGQYAGNDEYYEVIIRSLVDGSFSRILNINSIPVQASAVVHVQGSDAVSGANVVHGLNLNGNGIRFNGNINVQVNGGNIMSNSGIDKDGGSGNIIVNGGEILYVNGNTDKWKGNVSPTPRKIANPIFVPILPDPDCGTIYRDVPKSDKGKHTYSPGIYSKLLTINAHDDILFEPGLYCFMQGITDNGNSKMIGNGVTFVILGGEVKFNGNSEVHLTRPNDLLDPSGNQWGGMLFYVPPSAATGKDRVLEITGNNETVFAGTIFAPQGLCRIGGTSKVLGVHANIICLNIEFHGTPDLIINYIGAQNYRMSPLIELSE